MTFSCLYLSTTRHQRSLFILFLSSMEKTLGFLFGLYFFVIQVVIIGFMFQLSQLYVLAIINFVVLGILSLIARRVDREPKEHKWHKEETEKKTHHHENKEAVAPAHVYEAAGKKKKNNSSLIPFVISLIAAIVLYSISSGADLGVRILLISLGASILFWILTIIWRAHRKGFNRLFGTWLYRVLVLIGILVVGYQYFARNIGKAQSILTYLGQQISSMHLTKTPQTLSWDLDETFYLKEEGTVLDMWATTGDSPTAQLNEIISWTTENINPVVTWAGEETLSAPVISPETTLPSRVWTSLRMIDVLKYLLTTYNIPLVNTKDVRFSTVATTSTDYPYMRTAYAQKLIWSSTSSTKYTLCDTYIVMKGILEKWDVSYSKATVMQKYRDYAQTNNKLNGCEKGKVVKTGNL